MKKRSSSKQSPKRVAKTNHKREPITIGMDLGDKNSCYCLLGSDGQVLREGQVATTKKAMMQVFSTSVRVRIAIEVGTHSPWVSRLLQGFGHEVIVANPRQVKLITDSSRKNDRLDAQTLARLARVDPQLLRPIHHRSEKTQTDLMIIRVRAALVEAGTGLVNTARGLAKSLGERLPICDADQMGVKQMASLTTELRQAIEPLLQGVELLTEKIKESDREIEQIAREDYPETELLRQVSGVGPLIALTFVLTVEDKSRFQKSRDVGCYVGVRPRRSDSGEPTAAENHQGGGFLPPKDVGARSPLHPEPSRAGYGPEAMGPALGRARRQTSEEKGSRGCGAEAGHLASSVVGDRRSIRTAAKSTDPAGTEESGSLIRIVLSY
jgi:transposase